jgi:hypothetical protein
MRGIFFILFVIPFFTSVSAQLEITSGYAVNQGPADGAPLHVAYDFKIKNRLFTKSQIGYKYLYHFNDYVAATLKTFSWELHQTISYQVIKKKKYVFKPNVGINYKFYRWRGKMKPPLNTLPIRALVMGIRNNRSLILESIDGRSHDEYNTAVFGFSFQLQNQFRINDRIWLHITPFMEPDYDGSQNTGGCYVGVILLDL